MLSMHQGCVRVCKAGLLLFVLVLLRRADSKIETEKLGA